MCELQLPDPILRMDSFLDWGVQKHVSYSQYDGLLGHVEGGPGVLHRDCITGPRIHGSAL